MSDVKSGGTAAFTERRAFRVSGFLALLVLAADLLVWVQLVRAGRDNGWLWFIETLVVVALVTGFGVVNPNQALVVLLFGRYVGSLRRPGWQWTVPFTKKRRVSMRVRNFETERLKVSDADGNPVEIAAVVVWQVVETAKAVFAVDNHVQYVAVQAEAAVRHLATSYPYEAHEDGRTSLRDASVVSDVLTAELRDR
ncbi:MAG: SPFH domain-containing protein, partial [Micromonosporaceae bacterium]|nr:SPFH domain-containing protein [Micromonosporaceae bacterium]